MKDTPVPGPRQFATTHWSLVAAAGLDQAGQTRAREALEELCRTYWYPLYAFIRRHGHSEDAARDLTQAFFCAMIERRGWSEVSAKRGRFRAFLLAACKNFLANARRHGATLKRGGDVVHLSIDEAFAESTYAIECAATRSPEELYARCWANTIIRHAMESLGDEYRARNQSDLYDTIKDCVIRVRH